MSVGILAQVSNDNWIRNYRATIFVVMVVTIKSATATTVSPDTGPSQIAHGLRCTGGGGDCCTKEAPCDIGEGDCDKDNQCSSSLICGTDNCLWGGYDDCCMEMPAAHILKVNYDALITETGLRQLNRTMKNSMVNTLKIEEWRVQNVTCRNDPIQGTKLTAVFKILPPDERKYECAAGILEHDVRKLKTVVEDGTYVAHIPELSEKIVTRKGQAMGVDFREPVATVVGASTNTQGGFNMKWIIVGVGSVGGLLVIGLITYVAIKLNKVSPYRRTTSSWLDDD